MMKYRLDTKLDLICYSIPGWPGLAFHEDKFIAGSVPLRVSYSPVHGWRLWHINLESVADILLSIKLGRRAKARFVDGNNTNLSLDNLEENHV
jgi:hypothetical protein